MAKRLTAAFVRTVTEPGKHYDEHGLFLRVQPSGSKRWVQRIVVRGRRRELGLGGFPLVSLAEARRAAFDNRKLARAGGDPFALRSAAAVPTFAEAAELVIGLHAPTWRDKRAETGWRQMLALYAIPKIGRLRVDEITPADVMRTLLPIWNTKRETARKTRQRISTVMKWAIAEGHRQDNPAGDAIGAALPRNGNRRTHQRALPHAQVADAIAKVRASVRASVAAKLAFEFLVLTATRSGEVRAAEWTEVDLEAGVWTVPGGRTKTGRELRVPLSARAATVLADAAEIADGSGLAFPSPRGKPLSDSTLSKLVRELGIEAVPHGFRSSFRDWCGERTNAPREVAEAALGHAVGNQVEAAYARSDLFDKRRALMESWARYLNPTKAGVIEFPKGA